MPNLSTLVVIMVCIVIPVISYFDIKRLRNSPHPKAKARMYIIICLWYWFITAVVFYISPLSALYYAQFSFEYNVWFVLLATVVGGFWIVMNVLPIVLLRFSRKFKDKVSAEMTSKNFIFPVTRQENMLFLLVSVTVGFAEEIIFRAFLFSYFQAEPFELSVTVSFALVCIIFGLVHFLQGLGGIIQAVLFGSLMGFTYIALGSLLIPILIHILYDLRIIFLSRIVNRNSKYETRKKSGHQSAEWIKLHD